MIINWKDTKKELPKKDGVYLGMTSYQRVSDLDIEYYVVEFYNKAFHLDDGGLIEEIEPTRWAEMPQISMEYVLEWIMNGR